MKILISLFMFLFLSNGLWSQSPDDYLMGRACMMKGQYDSAIVLFDRALQQKPGDVDILFHRGISHFNLQNNMKAHEDFFQVERRQKGMASHYLARTEVRLNHPEQALKYLRIHLASRYKLPEKDILLDEELGTLQARDDWKALWNEKSWYNQNDRNFQDALFHQGNGAYLEAINLLNDLEKQGYRKSEVLTIKAEIYESLGNDKAVMAEIDRAVRSDVRNHNALGIRVEYAMKNGKFEEALADCDKLIRLDPAQFEAYLVRAVARSETGDLDGAVGDIDNYLLYFPDRDSAYFLKGTILYRHGKYLNAILSFNKALELNTGRAEYYHHRGLVYVQTGTLQYAEKDFSMALDLDPENGQTWFEKGKVAARLGKNETACHNYKKAYQYGVFEARNFIVKNCMGE
ncbi:MAG: tetratricopeptide repeat protein [Bacteroidales bacterium]|nr:tetratricopeptide repeat protein [Bacteroidales bacterium]MBN2697238.1 tetratricopeptide repeat protein [Bacteroidales bacterium]